MTPAARTQAAIELVDAIVAAARGGGAAADTLIARYFAERRYAGSKDRRAVRDLVYDAIRRLGPVPENGRAALVALADARPELGATFDGSTHGPAPIAPDEPRAAPGIAPDWLAEQLAASGIDESGMRALVARAPLDIRINRLRSDPALVREAFPGAEPLAFAPDALRLPPDSRAEQHPLFHQGAFEVQDAGSQLVALASGAAPGMAVVDLCAGGGGKTLALAAMMDNRGTLLACDVDRTRLSRLMPRAQRAGVTIVETRLLNPGGEVEALADWAGRADVVLVDAPCSGTGTWRRNPEARWRLSPARLARLTETQSRLLDIAAGLVRPGGAVVHIVCSLLDAEGRDQADAFLARHPGWRAAETGLGVGDRHGGGVRLTPGNPSTDGFFVAKLESPC